MNKSEDPYWVFENEIVPARQNKVVEEVAEEANAEKLKWFWDHTILPYHKEKIINGVVTRGDDETLKWFWDHTILPHHRVKIFNAMNMAEVNRNNRNMKKSEKPIALSEENSASNSFNYDVFICHASEDKESFVRTLAIKLSNKGFKVWYDDFTLLLGDSLRRKIDHGLANSRYGVVVLSKKFFEKDWPQKELDGLIAREEGSNKVILPIWHGITKKEVRSFSPILADRLAVSSDKGIDYVVNEIANVFKRTIK